MIFIKRRFLVWRLLQWTWPIKGYNLFFATFPVAWICGNYLKYLPQNLKKSTLQVFFVSILCQSHVNFMPNGLLEIGHFFKYWNTLVCVCVLVFACLQTGTFGLWPCGEVAGSWPSGKPRSQMPACQFFKHDFLYINHKHCTARRMMKIKI